MTNQDLDINPEENEGDDYFAKNAKLEWGRVQRNEDMRSALPMDELKPNKWDALSDMYSEETIALHKAMDAAWESGDLQVIVDGAIKAQDAIKDKPREKMAIALTRGTLSIGLEINVPLIQNASMDMHSFIWNQFCVLSAMLDSLEVFEYGAEHNEQTAIFTCGNPKCRKAVVVSAVYCDDDCMDEWLRADE